MSDKASNDTTATEEPVSWRELAVARSLDSARTRAENRVERFIEAALELMESSSGKDFTVQQVVEQSGQSLRSFYQYFDGKHELLLALFEESIRTTAEQLRSGFATETDPGERLHRFVVDYYRVCRPSTGKGSSTKKLAASPALVDFAQQLLTDHPAEAARAFRPLVTLFDEVLDAAAAAGAIRADLNRRRIAGVVLESIMFNAFSATIAGTSVSSDSTDDAEELWDFVFNGLGAGSGGSKKK